MCVLASAIGGFTGHHLWEHYWQQYSEVSLLKAGVSCVQPCSTLDCVEGPLHVVWTISDIRPYSKKLQLPYPGHFFCFRRIAALIPRGFLERKSKMLAQWISCPVLGLILNMLDAS